jgi:NAD(P)-dependent dehydrogenase (short-subunit alcohol dehydrogenase family)
MTQPETSRFAASAVAAGVDLGGKVAVVTGASGGLGAETARVLAERGAHVVLTAREGTKGEKVAPELAGRGGLYLEDCHVAGPKTSDDAPEGYCGYALDPEAAARLWAASEEMVGARFTFA